MQLDYIPVSRLLLLPVAKDLWKHKELFSVNLSEYILAAVLRYAALCIRLGGILRKWFVTTVLTLPTCPATSWNFVRIFCDDSEAIPSRISTRFPGGQMFPSGKHLKESAYYRLFVKWKWCETWTNFGKEFASEGVEATYIARTSFFYFYLKLVTKLRLIVIGSCNSSVTSASCEKSFSKRN